MMLDWGWDGGDDVSCSGRIVSCGVGRGFSWVIGLAGFLWVGFDRLDC